jgi:hypothetical protein
MVSVNTHGGFCCGARHLYSFDGIVNHGRSLDEINNVLSREIPFGRRVEVILNGRQVTSTRSPELLRRLADLGFVLSSHYKNHNHNPARDNFVFERCDTREALNDLPFDWPGMVISPGLTGRLPLVTALPLHRVVGAIDPNLPLEFEDGTTATLVRFEGERIYVTAAGPVGPANGRQGHTTRATRTTWWNMLNGGYGGSENTYTRLRNVVQFNVGDQVRITNPNSHYFNETGVVQVVTDLNLTINLRHFGLVSLRKTSCSVIERADGGGAPVVEAPPVFEPHRHTDNGHPALVGTPVAPPVTVIYQTYHNRYQDGRLGAGYASLEEARTAAPRCRARVRRDVSSDGTVNDVTLP